MIWSNYAVEKPSPFIPEGNHVWEGREVPLGATERGVGDGEVVAKNLAWVSRTPLLPEHDK